MADTAVWIDKLETVRRRMASAEDEVAVGEDEEKDMRAAART
jgi:hypothetical protein